MKLINKLWILLIVLAILTPIGLFLPEHFKAGAAWGEWGAEEMTELVGYIPRGLEKIATLWRAPMPDYAFEGMEDRALRVQSAAYILSAIVGIAAVSMVILILGKLFTGERR